MQSYQTVFQRIEKKYLLSEAQYTRLWREAERQLAPDEYGESLISSVYFDTPEFLLIQRSLQRPVYKEKLRLRGYGYLEQDSTVFAELKKKVEGVVYKRRCPLTLQQAEAYFYQQKQMPPETQIARELNWFCGAYPGLAPALFLSYRRTAFYGVEENGLRVTFDRDVRWRREEMRLGCGECGSRLLGQGQILMEIKLPGAMPLWLAHALDAQQIFPTRFSKVGNAYLQLMAAQNGKGGGICA